MPARLEMFEAAPLVEAVERSGARAPTRTLARNWYRVRKAATITANMADQIAVGMLGQHPASIYGRRWWE